MCPPSSLTKFKTPSPSSSTLLTPSNSLLTYIPQDITSTSAYTLATTNLPIAILNHSLRVYLYAKAFAKQRSSHEDDDFYSYTSSKQTLLFVTCILHDIGCASRFDRTLQRFEVEGADAAKAHLLEHGVPERDAHDVWVAIACHTSPQIAETISALAGLVRASVVFDFAEATAESNPRADGSVEEPAPVLNEELRSEVESLSPRLQPEKVLGDAVVEQARRQREKAPAASWPGVLLRAALEEPEWDGVNKAF